MARFIATSSPLASLLGSRPLLGASTLAFAKGTGMTVRRNRSVASRLVIEGLAVALVLAVGIWGVLVLGHQATATKSHHYTPVARIAVVDATVCLAPDTQEVGRAGEAVRAGKGAPCPEKYRSLTTTSRQPGLSSSRRSAPRDAKAPDP